MAKNYIQAGSTIEIKATDEVKSGELVTVGDVVAVAITDIAIGNVGDGLAVGVFSLPKLATDNMAAGKKVYLKDGKVQLDATGSLPFVGLTWAAAAVGIDVVSVKING